jgi:hypothetical protein
VKCKLTRVRSIHANLRTREAEGISNDPPTVGEVFVLIAEALNPDPRVTARMIETTEVLEVTENPDADHLKFSTVNSDYEWELLT